MIAALVPDVLAHAAREQPRECCGLAVVVRGRMRYWPARNVAGEAEFELYAEDAAAAEDAGEVVGVCHSHVNLPPLPSEADRVMCEASGLPWLIVGWPTGAHRVIEPSGYRAPLLGRPFTHGVLDCYTLIRDWYASELGIALPDFVRGDDWWLRGGNLYRDNFTAAGFEQVAGNDRLDEMRPHDVLLMQVAAPVENHAAVYIGENRIVQHCHGRLSSRDVYGGYWRKVTTAVLRHRETM